MRVSFINPPIFPYRKIMRNFDCATESKGNYLYQPYDFLLLSAKLPSHWPLLFIDAIANKWNRDKCFSELESFLPEIIVCAVAATNWKQDLEFVQNLRQKFPQAYLLVFGDILIEDIPCQKIQDYCDGILTSPIIFDFSLIPQKQNGLRTKDFYNRSDLKKPTKVSLTHIRHRAFLHPKYRWPFARYFQYTTIFTAWGCPYSCSYCIMSKFPNYWRDYQEIIAEMEEVKNLGIKEIYIGDRSFGLPYENIISLLDTMIERKFNFSWSTYFHPNQYTPELLEKMKASGCHTIIIGIESGDLKSLQEYSRYMKKDILSNLISHANKLGIDICGDFILGLPHDDKDSIEKTIEFSQALNIDYASFNIATPLAGSSIRKLAIESGKMQEEDQFDSLGNSNALSVCKLSEKEILKLRNKAVMGFYTRPSYLIKRLFKIRGYQHFLIQLQEALQILSKASK